MSKKHKKLDFDSFDSNDQMAALAAFKMGGPLPTQSDESDGFIDALSKYTSIREQAPSEDDECENVISILNPPKSRDVLVSMHTEDTSIYDCNREYTMTQSDVAEADNIYDQYSVFDILYEFDGIRITNGRQVAMFQLDAIAKRMKNIEYPIPQPDNNNPFVNAEDYQRVIGAVQLVMSGMSPSCTLSEDDYKSLDGRYSIIKNAIICKQVIQGRVQYPVYIPKPHFDIQQLLTELRAFGEYKNLAIAAVQDLLVDLWELGPCITSVPSDCLQTLIASGVIKLTSEVIRTPYYFEIKTFSYDDDVAPYRINPCDERNTDLYKMCEQLHSSTESPEQTSICEDCDENEYEEDACERDEESSDDDDDDDTIDESELLSQDDSSDGHLIFPVKRS